MPHHDKQPPHSAPPASAPARDAATASDAEAAQVHRAGARPLRYSEGSLQALASVLPGLRWLIGLLIASVLIAGLYFGRDILIPLALAVLLGFLLDPAVTRLKRWGLSRMAATLLVVSLALGALTGMGFYLGKQVQGLSAALPTYQNTIKQKLKNLRALSSGPSMWDGAIKTYSAVETEINRAAAAAERGKPPVQKVEVVREEPKQRDVLLQWLDKVSEPIAMIGIVLLFVILILLDRDGLRDRLLRLMGGNLHVATDALDEASERIGKYLRMQFIVNVAYGIPMAAGLWLIGVPGAILWGVTATILRFVPYVGPMIAAVFPLVLAFAVAPGWDMLLWTLGLVLLLELISNNVVEPWLYGASTGLSTLAIIMAATFWTALWGPIGLILSTPLTVCCLVLGRYLPGLQFMEVLLSSQPVLDAPHRLYQRLLADDVNGALEIAQQDVAERMPSKPLAQDMPKAVMAFYEHVGLPALNLAYKHHVDNATAEHRIRLSSGMEAVLEELQEDYPAPAAPPAEGHMPLRVHCVGARWEVDALAADMAAHSLQLHGIAATSAGYAMTAAQGPEETEGWDGVQWLVITSFHAQPQAKVRQLVRRIRRRYPGLVVVLALWNAAPEVLQEAVVQRMGAVSAVASLQELLLRMQHMLSPEQAHDGYVPAAVPAHDAHRVQALQHSGFLSPVYLPAYKAAVLKVANAFNVKYAQVSLVDRDWVHTPGSLLVRSHESETPPGLPRDISVCSYVVRDGADLVVEDVARDPRFASNPALSEAGVKFYAGVPLQTRQGEVLGSFCIMHDSPRALAEDEMDVLHDMAAELMSTLRAERKAASRSADA